MHWCPICGEPCYCDGDDTDYGEFIPEDCPNHGYCQGMDRDFEYEDEEDENT